MRVPDQCITVRTYEELDRFARAFAGNHLGLLIVLGSAGLGKSQTLKQHVRGRGAVIEGTVRPFALYKRLYRERNRLILLDEADPLFYDRDGIRLLRCLCQTDPSKKIGWLSDAHALKREGIPQEFATTSKVAIVTNSWPSNSIDITALADRGHVVCFDPTALEVHRHAATFFRDQEIFDFIAAHLHLIRRPSLRLYETTRELKAAGEDWRRLVMAKLLTGTSLLVAQLLSDPKYRTDAERIKAFIAAAGGCRATYFNHKREVEPTEQVPRIVLPQAEPDGPVVLPIRSKGGRQARNKRRRAAGG